LFNNVKQFFKTNTTLVQFVGLSFSSFPTTTTTTVMMMVNQSSNKSGAMQLSGSTVNTSSSSLWSWTSSLLLHNPQEETSQVLVQQQQQHPRLSKVEKVIQMLQEQDESRTTSFRYYVYNHPNMTRMDIRRKAMAGNWTWAESWGDRYKDFALWEIRYLEALERNTRHRTYNASQADFIVIPIPMSALVTASGGGQSSSSKSAGFIADTRLALNTLYAQPLFQSSSQTKGKHVFFTFLEGLFHPKRLEFIMGRADYKQFRPVSVATVEDIQIWGRIPQSTKDQGYWDHTLPQLLDKPIRSRIFTNHGFSIQYIGAATDPEHERVILNKTAFDQKHYIFFYHTIKARSMHNSTRFRHATTRRKVMRSLLQPSSIGYRIPADQWLSQFQDSKFCLVIRGDNPVSRSMWRAIKNGCIPVIVSNAMPYWAPVFRSMINLQDYAVMVDEKEFLQYPAIALNQAIQNLTDHDIEQKIAGLNLVQRLILPDEPDSLFVAAFAHETMASQTREYYDVSVKLYGDEHQISLTF
jgi:Exostosin family